MDALRHNLPVQPTPLIGRDRDVAAAIALLARDDVHLLTVTGPAGVGKTRLAVAVAAACSTAFEDGVRLVDLAPAGDPSLVPAAIGGALGLREARGTPLVESLVQHLADRQMLLLLDNFEHLLGAAPLVGDLLAACPRLKALVTSRAPLRLRWEQELPLMPLELPRSPSALDRAELARVPAVALFVERARAVEPAFTLDRHNAQSVAELCSHLDGLPLAIELAAARVRLLSPRAMLARLAGGGHATSLDLLAPGALDMPARHQTLRAAIGWSHDLLSPEHRALFRRLAVFVGGCTLDLAEEVCGGSAAGDDGPCGSILDSLGLLVENHLLRRDVEPDGEPRFRTLATIREFAAERLEASGEADAVRHRHALALMALAHRAESELGGPREAESLTLLEREYDNLRAALTYLSQCGEVEPGLRASRALWRFWSVRGHLSEGRAWLTTLLERDRQPAPPSLARSLALSAAGWMALEQDDIAAARASCEEGLAIARACNDAELEAEHLSQLGHAARQQGEHTVAQSYYERSLAIREARGDHLGTAWSLRNLAHVARLRGDYETACGLYQQSLAVGGPTAPRSEVAGTLGYLANALLRSGNVNGARDRFAESLVICQEVGHRRRLAYALEGLAGVAAARGEWERALRLGGAATALRELIGAPLWPAGLAALENRLAPARHQLGPVRAAECWDAGRLLPIDQAVAEALEQPAPPARSPVRSAVLTGSPRVSTSPTEPLTPAASGGGVGSTHGLTHRELEVARLIARGLTNRQIADALVISEGTAAVHVKHILNKLDVQSRAQVAAWTVRRGLVGDPDRPA